MHKIDLVSSIPCELHSFTEGKKSAASPGHLCVFFLSLHYIYIYIGAVFACMAFVDMLSMGVAFPVFSSIYAATISWFSGFTFLLAAGLTFIPALIIG